MYTNGLARIIRAYDALVVKELNFNIGNNTKVDQAHIAYKSYMIKAGQRHFEKSITLTFAFSLDQAPEGSKKNRNQMFKLTFNELVNPPQRAMTDQKEADSFELGTNVDAINICSEEYDSEITQVLFKNETESFWVATQGDQKTTIEDLAEKAIVWDREMNEDFQCQLDEVFDLN